MIAARAACRYAVCMAKKPAMPALDTHPAFALSAAWETHLRRDRGRSVHTVRAYAATAQRLIGFLGRHRAAAIDGKALATVDVAELRGFLAERRGEGIGNASAARELSALRGFLARLLGWRTDRLEASSPSSSAKRVAKHRRACAGRASRKAYRARSRPTKPSPSPRMRPTRPMLRGSACATKRCCCCSTARGSASARRSG